MIRSKKYYAERVLTDLQDAFRNADFKINVREVFLVLDDIVNSMATQNYFANWKIVGGPQLDEQFITTWDGDNAIDVIDVDDQPSYINFPSNYAALPMNGGIIEVWPMNYEFGSVRLMNHSDIRRTRRLMSGNLQQELGGYPKGSVFTFNQCDVAKNYSQKFGVRLAIRDSTAISETAPYPIPSDLEETVINRAVMKFKERRMSPTDLIRDKNDALNRN